MRLRGGVWWAGAVVVGALGVVWAVAVDGEDAPREDALAPDPPMEAVAQGCGACHGEVVALWEGSHHALAQRPLEEGDSGRLEIDGRTVDVVGRIGVDPLVQWLVDDGRRRTQVTQVAVHTPTGERFDVFGDDREAGEWGHWTGGGMTWNRMCASCHATDVRKGWDGSGYDTTMAEPGVGCAACHDDASDHLAGGPPPAATSGIDTCAPCHARRAELTDGWPAGAPFLDHFAPTLVDGQPGGLYWPDGQIREEVFEWTAFASSRMHQVGVGCSDCHEPHSGALVRSGDALCLGCHEALPGFVPHDRHEEGVDCVGCHMPVTTYMQRDPRHDHGFRIPDPVTAQALGLPDACSRCHEGRDNPAAFEAWYGPRAVDSRTAAFAAPVGEEDVPALLAVLTDPDQAPVWRASAAARLQGHSEASTVEALRAAATDPNALVRFGAVGALDDPEVLRRALKDPVRAVRVAAARALGGSLDPTSAEARDAVSYLQHNGDHPEALLELGGWLLSRGSVRQAIVPFEAAVSLDPQRLTALDALAVAYSSAGRGAEAAEMLERATGLAPDDAVLWGRLGLARVQAGDVMGAEVALERAADGGAPRAAYNLGLLLAQRGAHADAVRALFEAEAREDTAEVRYAIASTLWQWGRRDEARIAAKRVLQLDPAHEGARALLALPR